MRPVKKKNQTVTITNHPFFHQIVFYNFAIADCHCFVTWPAQCWHFSFLSSHSFHNAKTYTHGRLICGWATFITCWDECLLSSHSLSKILIIPAIILRRTWYHNLKEPFCFSLFLHRQRKNCDSRFNDHHETTTMITPVSLHVIRFTANQNADKPLHIILVVFHSSSRHLSPVSGLAVVRVWNKMYLNRNGSKQPRIFVWSPRTSWGKVDQKRSQLLEVFVGANCSKILVIWKPVRV